MTKIVSNVEGETKKDSKLDLYWFPPAIIAVSICGIAYDAFTQHCVTRYAVSTIRAQVYSGFASGDISILGFMLAAATILLTIDSVAHLPRVASTGNLLPVFELFIKTMLCFTICLIVSIVALFYDRDSGTKCAILSDSVVGLHAIACAYLIQSIAVLRVIGSTVTESIQAKTKQNRLDELKKIDDGNKSLGHGETEMKLGNTVLVETPPDDAANSASSSAQPDKG